MFVALPLVGDKKTARLGIRHRWAWRSVALLVLPETIAGLELERIAADAL
jgi:hypothetical protein